MEIFCFFFQRQTSIDLGLFLERVTCIIIITIYAIRERPFTCRDLPPSQDQLPAIRLFIFVLFLILDIFFYFFFYHLTPLPSILSRIIIL